MLPTIFRKSYILCDNLGSYYSCVLSVLFDDFVTPEDTELE